jgi:hypothetical protein
MKTNFIDGSKISPYCIISCLFAELQAKSGRRPGKKSISTYMGTYNKNDDKAYTIKKEEKEEGAFSDMEQTGAFLVQHINEDQNINESAQTPQGIVFPVENPDENPKPIPVVEEPEELYGINTVSTYEDNCSTPKEEKSQNEENLAYDIEMDLSDFQDENSEIPTITAPKVIEISFSSLLELFGGFLGDISNVPLSSLIKITKLPEEAQEEP